MKVNSGGRRLADLGAVITESMTRSSILLYKDGGARLIFDSGNRIDTVVPGDLEAGIKFFTKGESPFTVLAQMGGEIKIHRVPAELTTDLEVLDWFQNMPELFVEFQNQVNA